MVEDLLFNNIIPLINLDNQELSSESVYSRNKIGLIKQTFTTETYQNRSTLVSLAYNSKIGSFSIPQEIIF